MISAFTDISVKDKIIPDSNFENPSVPVLWQSRRLSEISVPVACFSFMFSRQLITPYHELIIQQALISAAAASQIRFYEFIILLVDPFSF